MEVINALPGGTIVKDEEGDRWILLISNKGRRWERISESNPGAFGDNDFLFSTKNYCTYVTHNNGSAAFEVVVTADKVFVMAILEENQLEHILTLTNYKDVLIGADSGLPETEGNSILVNTEGNNYVYIGTETFRFQTKSPVLEYYSPIGGGDVPYPYAVTKDRVYLMLNHVSIDLRPELLTLYSTYEDVDLQHEPYQFYYNHEDKSEPFDYEVIVPKSESISYTISIYDIVTA